MEALENLSTARNLSVPSARSFDPWLEPLLVHDRRNINWIQGCISSLDHYPCTCPSTREKAFQGATFLTTIVHNIR